MFEEIIENQKDIKCLSSKFLSNSKDSRLELLTGNLTFDNMCFNNVIFTHHFNDQHDDYKSINFKNCCFKNCTFYSMDFNLHNCFIGSSLFQGSSSVDVSDSLFFILENEGGINIKLSNSFNIDNSIINMNDCDFNIRLIDVDNFNMSNTVIQNSTSDFVILSKDSKIYLNSCMIRNIKSFLSIFDTKIELVDIEFNKVYDEIIFENENSFFTKVEKTPEISIDLL